MEAYAKLGVDEYWIVEPKDRIVEIYYLESGKYILKEYFDLENDEKNHAYNADTVIPLRKMPAIRVALGELFAGITTEDDY